MSDTPQIDAVVVGGGMAGLFTLRALLHRGFSACLVERRALGSPQSVCAQGIVHGGVKYSLGGLVSGSARAIERMPERWLAMAAGTPAPGDPDLRAAPPLARQMWLWRSAGAAGALAMAGARLALRARPEPVRQEDVPAALGGVIGDILRMPEPVFDTRAVLEALASPVRSALVHGDLECRPDGSIAMQGAGGTVAMRPRSIVLCAGAGNESLRSQLGLAPAIMQLRPLHQAMVRGDLPDFHGHCVDGMATRVTITSARGLDGRRIWHIGGKLAEEGVARDETRQRAHALAEMRAVMPGVDWSGCEWSTYRVDRAERAQPRGQRPEDACIERESTGGLDVLTVWPTKMALAPIAADAAADCLGAPRHGAAQPWVEQALAQAPRPEVATAPWEWPGRWVPTEQVAA